MTACMSMSTDNSADDASHSGVSADSALPVLLEDWELDSLVTHKKKFPARCARQNLEPPFLKF